MLEDAREQARRWVEPLGLRWTHVQAVGRAAERIAEPLGLDLQRFAAAAWLHDIGYAPELVDTGFHPVDGARRLRRGGWDALVVSLVAHHSCARVEAAERGLAAELAGFARPPAEYEDALCFCDMTNGPDGRAVTAPERLGEIERRYGPEHVVTRFVRLARPEIMGSVARVTDRLVVADRRNT